MIANLVRKRGDGRVVAHFVNYGPPVENVAVRLNVAAAGGRVWFLSPDASPGQLHDVSVRGAQVTFTIPRLDVYGVVVLE